MIPRADSPSTPRPDPEFRVIEHDQPVVAGPVGSDTACASRTDGSIAYADRDLVLASARRMLEIHRDTFRKLAE